MPAGGMLKRDGGSSAGSRRSPTAGDFLRIAQQNLGFQSLRPGQEEALQALFEGHDVLAVLPTGSGKSAIYQIAGELLPGATIVISPLIALQRDQAFKLESTDTGGGAIVNSSVSTSNQDETFEDLEHETLEFVFLAPEQLHREEVLEHLGAANPSLFVVDEAHCISEWGHDFRPDYLRLGRIVDALDHPRVLALTATAPPRVREEIVERLHMRKPRMVMGDMDRPNIWIGVRECRSADEKLRLLMAEVTGAQTPGIVYVATRRHAEEAARALQDEGVEAAAYHAGMKATERDATQQAFMKGELPVIVATPAFGMGVDKADVRFVFHFDVVHSPETYYQEIGRGGRDGLPARAVLFYRREDLALHRFFAAGGRMRGSDIDDVADAVAKAGELDEDGLREQTNLSRPKLARVATELEEQGVLARNTSGTFESAEPEGASGDLRDAALERDARHHEAQLRKLDCMRIYAETLDCRRQYLLEYLGQEAGPCGRCDNCERAGAAFASRIEGEMRPGVRVRHAKLGRGMIIGRQGDRVTILFEESGEKVLDARFVENHGLLARALVRSGS